MQRQMRIDQFYKSIGTVRSSGLINVKTDSKAKSISDSKIIRNKKNQKRNMEKYQCITESDTVSDVTIAYEKIANVQNISVKHTKETKDNKEVCLIQSNNNYERDSNFNQGPSVNNTDVQLQREFESEFKNDSPTKEHKFTNNHGMHLNESPRKKLRSIRKDDSQTESNSTSSTPTKLNNILRTPSCESQRPILGRKLFGDFIDKNIVLKAIRNMNMARRDFIPLHNLDLEEIYSRNTFQYQFSEMNIETSSRYNECDIEACDDLNSKILFTTIFNVLSNPINCGYFNKTELDFIYSIITLPRDPQMLLARVIRRKRTWYRKSNINYEDISSELKDAFDILVSRSICTFDTEELDLSAVLELLQVEELRKILQGVKMDPKGTKKNNIQKLLKLSKNKPLFPGMKHPSVSLRTSAFAVLDYCVCITPQTWDIIDRIVTLLLPNQDPSDTMGDTYFMLCEIYLGKTVFPNISGCSFPIFSSRQHLISYTKAKSTLSATLQQIVKKNWTEVQSYGDIAMDTLPNLLKTEAQRLQNSVLPLHVRRYMPGFVWLKILSASVPAFNKISDKKRVVEILHFLVEQNCHMHASKGKWYTELALIEMHHLKNIEGTALIIVRALNKTEDLTQVDKLCLLQRATKIVNKKTGVNLITRGLLRQVLNDHNSELLHYEVPRKIINAKPIPQNTVGSKNVWQIAIPGEHKCYGSVETLALHYYWAEGFPDGLHCEGALPVILFVILFWEEIYGAHVSGAFATEYQEAPSDLFTGEFYANRKERIDLKFQIAENLNCEEFSCMMEDKLKTFGHYRSIMSTNLLNNIRIKEIVCCLGVQGVLGICRKLVKNFKLWKDGFPDLFMWNYHAKTHKIVEVKGPHDTLSMKQRLWMACLDKIGLNAEVCLVQD